MQGPDVGSGQQNQDRILDLPKQQVMDRGKDYRAGRWGSIRSKA